MNYNCILRVAMVLAIMSLILGHKNIFAQQNVGIGTVTPNSKSILELVASDKGILIPRLSSVERIAVNPSSMEDGLLVYDIDSKLFYYWNGNTSAWVPFPQTIPDDDFVTSGSYNSATGILTLSMNSGGSVSIPLLIDTDDQTLSFNNATGELTISDGNTVTLASGSGDDWGGQVVQVDGVTITGNGTAGSPLMVTLSGTDNQNLTSATLSGTTLTIDIEDGTSTSVDLAPILPPGGSDDQNLTTATLTASTLTIGIEDGSSASVDLSPLQDGTGTDDQNLTGASLTGTILNIDIEDGTSASVDLAPILPPGGSDDQNLTGASLTGTTLTIDIESGSSASVDLLAFDDADILSTAFNPDGTFSINTDVPATITSPNGSWLTSGNTAIGAHYIGTNNATDFRIFSNANERMSVESNGQVIVNNIAATAGDRFSSYGAPGENAMRGYSGGTGTGVSGMNDSNGNGVFAENIGLGRGLLVNASGDFANGLACVDVVGSGTGHGVVSIVGAATNPATVAIMGYNYRPGDGLGVVGIGGGSNLYIIPGNGLGVTGSGGILGLSGNALSTSTSGAFNYRAGGEFQSGGDGGNPVVVFSSYAYVGVMSNAAVDANGGTPRKIVGNGTVNTVIKDLDGKYRLMSAPEAPENLFEDYGEGFLVNGFSSIQLDPIFSKNIAVNEKHPLRVFIQLEGDCQGVYVTNKSRYGFDVVELMNGESSVPFTWKVVANRKDDRAENGTLLLFEDERFPEFSGPHQHTAATVPDPVISESAFGLSK